MNICTECTEFFSTIPLVDPEVPDRVFCTNECQDRFAERYWLNRWSVD